MKEKQAFRRVVNTLHLWVGIPCALILFIVCLTGTAYVFQKEIVHWLDREKYTVKTIDNKPALKLDSLVHLLESQNKGLKTTVVQIPASKDEAWLFSLAPKSKGKEAADKISIKKQTRLLLVNPCTGQVQGNALSTGYRFFDNVVALHRWLLMDNHAIGGAITGTAAFLFLFLEITGIILWLPAKLKNWKKWTLWRPGFVLKWNGGWKRKNHDLHKVLGFYTFLLITILAVTGPYFAYEWYRKPFAALFGAQPVKKETAVKKQTGHKPADHKMTLDSALTLADHAFPYNGDLRLNMPKGGNGSLTISKVETGFFASPGTDRIEIDLSLGRIKKIDAFQSRTFGEKIITSIRAIHTGEILGTFSKIIYFIACLLATSLPVTGVFIWINKNKKKKTVTRKA
ncbi:MAG: PepSY-associated TM helix domain-containing protein [Chitinophagaceae bacterium]